jgi:3',5'-cyclic AMP phosphodiesterase CpdA
MLRVLHLSDPHFGLLSAAQQAQHHSDPSAHRYVKGDGTPDEQALANILIADKYLKEAPDILLVSGDLAWSGAAEDYEYALTFLKRLKVRWPAIDIVVAPGNHDVDWSRFPQDTRKSRQKHRHGRRRDGSQDAYLAFVRKLYGTRFDDLYPLLKDTPLLDRETLVGIHRGGIRNQTYVVVSVNSAAHIQQEKRPVHIRPALLKQIDEQLDGLNASLRIFVLHHHLLPFAEPSSAGAWDPQTVPDTPDPTIVANSAKLQTWLAQRGFTLVVHGHKHLSHGRVDELWKKTDAEGGRRLFIVGAGSAGVATHERGPNIPLCYNLITLTQLSDKRWQAEIAVRQISEDGAYPEAVGYYDYTADLGPASDAAPVVIHATRADQCHEAIRVRTMRTPMLHNFISIVDDGKYTNCPTVMRDGHSVEDREISRSFQALHPEYIESKKWRARDKIESALREAGPHFQFSHGPRLFGIPLAARKLRDPDVFRPVVRALDTLGRGNTSNAYVGLFSAEIDVVSAKDEPLPALVGIQFIPRDENQLDIVATFRKLELSYWWAVNMYEAAQLLEWGSAYAGRKPGRITFFAPLAEWKRSPETTLVAALDDLKLSELIPLMIGVARRDDSALVKLRDMLIEKEQHTNEKNLDPRGLVRLLQVISGLTVSGIAGDYVPLLQTILAAASKLILNALKEHRDDDGLVSKARAELRKAISLLPPRRRQTRKAQPKQRTTASRT